MIPETTEWMQKQMRHIPTKEYGEDIFRLAKRFPFSSALEVGCAWGISTLALLSACPEGKLTTVDKSEYKEPFEEVKANGLSDRWEFILSDSRQFWAQDDKTGTFDFVYIDGDHSYDLAKIDIPEGWKRVNPGGILAIDDAAHKNNRMGSVDPYGVAIASLELWMNNPNIKECGFEGRILWFKKP